MQLRHKGHALFFQLHYRQGKEEEVSSSFFIVLVTAGVTILINLLIQAMVSKKEIF